MSSREIAELVNQRHDNVKRTIETLGTKGVISHPQIEEFGRVGFEIAPFETAGGQQQREIAVLNEQQSTLILTYMRNSDIVRRFKKSLVKAFYELHGQRQADYASLSTMQILQIAMQSEKERLALAEKIEEMLPKANGYDLIAGIDGSLCMTDAAKELQIKPKQLITWLSCNEWIYKRAGSATWIGYHDKIQQGLIEMKAAIYQNSAGEDCQRPQVRITGKGLAKLAKQFATDING